MRKVGNDFIHVETLHVTTCLARYSLCDSVLTIICDFILGLPHSRELLGGSVNLVQSPEPEVGVMYGNLSDSRD